MTWAIALQLALSLSCGACAKKKPDVAASAASANDEQSGASDPHRALADRGVSKQHRAFSMPADLSETAFGQVRARFVAFGDSGTGGEQQRAVAVAMKRFCDAQKCEFALHLGDIVYPEGIDSPTDPDIGPRFEQPYAPLGIPIYLSLGNHDHYGKPDAWVAAYGDKGVRRGPKAAIDARLPARYYTFKRGGVRFLALDTHVPSQEQARWADRVLRRSRRDREPWVVAFGHHPRISHGAHEDARQPLASFLDKVLCHRVDLYLAGHDHDKQILKPRCGVHQVVSGAAGKLRPISPGSRSVHAHSSAGWAWLVADRDRLRVSFHDTAGKEEFARTYTRTRPIPVCEKDGVCNGMCRTDADCVKGSCAADKRCDPNCTDDPDCGVGSGDANACACDRQPMVCEISNTAKQTICACDPACQAGHQPCGIDGWCDTNCRDKKDLDCS